MKPRRINVEVPGARYPIHLGRGAMDLARLYPAGLRAGRGLIVTNETVAPLYLDRLQRALHPARPPTLVLPDGERHKTLGTARRILDAMFRAGLNRDATVVALGGGVIGDMTGFAASIYQRGVPFIQVPTTLLAQVDSSVGGKTAVNHPRGKNMIGAFHQPAAVISDLATLDTLPARELAAGLAEVIKTALLGDARQFAWLQRQMPALLARDEVALARAVASACRSKAAVVAADEREQGQRALLNLGHTFGHAIEAHLRYRDWLHGEAVAVGLCMAADLSRRHGWIDADSVSRVQELVATAGLPTRPPAGLGARRMRRLMAADKKVAAGRLRLILLRRIGEAVISADYDDQLLERTLASFCESAR